MYKILIATLALTFVLAAVACEDSSEQVPRPSMPIITPVPAGTR